MINFYEDSHKYLVDGLKVIPSVSELVKFATGEKYVGIPEIVLQRAAEFGTTIHDAIQDDLENGVDTCFFEEKLLNAYSEYKRLKALILSPYQCEQIISYKNRYAGRFDLLANEQLIDIKTNSKYDDTLQTHLEWQLGYYKLAMEDMGYTIKSCHCLYLPKKGSGKLVEITPTEKELLLQKLEEYEKERSTRD